MSTATAKTKEAAPGSVAGGLLRLMRLKQWTKNLFVFAAPLFVLDKLPPGAWPLILLTFAAMCLISSSTYILNDVLDVEHDRQHPIKKSRPIAAGTVPVGFALAVALVLFAGGLALAGTAGRDVLGGVGVYLGLQVLYNLVGRRVPVLDVFLISLGFVVRAVLGAVAINVPISSWLLLCTGALALLLGFGKRRHEFILQAGNTRSRKTLEGYNRAVLDNFLVMTALGAAISYAVYAIQSKNAIEHPGLILSTPFVFYAIFRYIYVVFATDEGGEPESLLFRDPHIVASIVLFVVSIILAMSGLKMEFLN
ncbi:MAG: decaprenyl-phosphate phosphoribosyltransferase [Fimbriimonadaceae bacterium]